MKTWRLALAAGSRWSALASRDLRATRAKTTAAQLVDALRAALDDSGLSHRDIDALYLNGGGDFDRTAEQFGLAEHHVERPPAAHHHHGNVLSVPPSALAIGMRVGVVFEDVTPEVTLPQFRPVVAG